MTDSYKPTNTPGLLPYFTVKNAEEAVKFYTEAFGFETVEISRDEKNNPLHVEMRKKDVLIMFCAEGAFGTTNKAPVTQGITMPLTLYIYCEDVDKLYDQAIKCGAKSKLAPNNGFWGDRFCTILDIDGYEWSFATYLNV